MMIVDHGSQSDTNIRELQYSGNWTAVINGLPQSVTPQPNVKIAFRPVDFPVPQLQPAESPG